MSKKNPVLRKLMVLVAMLAMALVAAAPAMAQSAFAKQGTISGDQSSKPPTETDDGVQGTITKISGSVVLVEEDPSEESGPKGYFTVTDETEIFRLQDDERAPAAFEDLEVGQLVEAAYEGDVAASYPPQGNAGSIAILEETTCMLPEGCEPGKETVSATFELTVECEPPSGTGFSASIGQGPAATGALLDQDGDGVYTTSLPVEQGTEQKALIERLDPISDEPQAPLTASTIKDFGTVEFDEDKTFSASVSFCDDDGSGKGGSDKGGSDKGGSDKGGSGGAKIKELPKTGGAIPVALGAGVLLVVGGLLARRFTR